MKYKLKHVVEYAALRAVAGFILLLPYRVALMVGWLLAGLAFYVVRYRVDTAKARIREVFRDRFDEREVNRIAWISLRNMIFNVVEIIRMPGVNRAWVDRFVDYSSSRAAQNWSAAGQGAIHVIPHTGNWDLAGVCAHIIGFPTFFIVGRQSNPLSDAYLNRMRKVTGIQTIPRDSSVLKQVIRNLREGKVLGFMTDLRSRTKAVTVRFLGKEANVVGGMALFARQARVPIYPAVITRQGWAHHQWRYHDPVQPDYELDKEADWSRMTQQVMDLFDEAVRRQPEQYFWYNKRWVLDPLEPEEPSTSEDEPASLNTD